MQLESTNFEIVMLATPEVEDYAWLGKKSWSKYAATHGYKFHLHDHKLFDDMHINWTKIELVRQRLNETKSKFLLLVDADSFVFNPKLSLDDLLDPSKKIQFGSDSSFPYPGVINIKTVHNFKRGLVNFLRFGEGQLPNAGFILMKVDDYSRWFFREWLELAQGELSEFADTHPRNQNVLWRGLLRKEKSKLGLFSKQVIRLTREKQISYLDQIQPFVIHFRHKSLMAEDLSFLT